MKVGFSQRDCAVLIVSGTEGDTRRYRCLHQQEQLTLNDVRCTVKHFSDSRLLEGVVDYRIVILHRVPYTDIVEAVIHRAREAGGVAIFDTDDLIFEPELTSWVDGLSMLPPDEVKLYHEGVRRYRRTLELCDCVLTSTEFIADLVRQRGKRAYVNRNSLSVELIRISEEACRQRAAQTDVLTIGYASGTYTHNKDFQEAAEALVYVMERHPDLQLCIVGYLDMPPEFEHPFDRLRAPLQDRIRRIPFIPWRELPAVLSTFDVNLSPLEMGNPFCRAKSELKYFEAAIVGVPTVASRIDAFTHAIEHGVNGLLAGNTAEWIAGLEALINDESYRRAIGERAREHVYQNYTPQVRGQELIQTLDAIVQDFLLGSPRVTAPTKSDRLTVNWVMLEPIKGSGGYTSVFRMIRHLAQSGHEVRAYVEPDNLLVGKSEKEIEGFINQHFFETGARIVKGHEFARADAIVATAWPTAKIASDDKGSRKKFYYVQDFEPYFYPMGEEYAQAESTYRLGLSHITLGRWLTELLRERYGADADYIDFGLDREIYYPRPIQNPERPRIVFYARPSTPRRGFKLGVEALNLVYRSAPQVEIMMFGAQRLRDYPIPFPHVDLGIASEEELAELYSGAAMGLVLSYTNCSFVPFEMMACRCPVVAVDTEPVRGLLRDGVNAIVTPAEPRSLAQGMLTLLEDRGLRQRIVANGYQEVQDLSWEKSRQQFEEILLRKVASTTKARSTATGYPKRLGRGEEIPIIKEMDVLQNTYDRAWGEICGEKRVGQSFLSRQKNLCRIDLIMATHRRENSGQLILHLRDDPTSSVDLATASVDMGDVMEGDWHAFTFPPILDSQDRQFYFYLDAPEATFGSAVSVWMSASDVYADGSAYSDHQPIQGDLAFRTFYLSGLGEGVKEMPTETHELMNRVQNLQWDLRQVGAELAMIQASRAYRVCSRLGLIGRRSVGPRYRPWSAQAPLVIKVWRCLRYMGIRGLFNEARAYLHWRFVLKGKI
jgi:glycosyltransferase involved in cell wall biosynthesis